VENTELQKNELQQMRERNAVLQEQQGRQELANRKVNTNNNTEFELCVLINYLIYNRPTMNC
jgi:hypothetical protein